MPIRKGKKYCKILVAVDGSDSSIDAAECAVAMAKKVNGAELIALHVISSSAEYAYSTNLLGLVTPSSIKEMLEDAKQQVQKWFDKIKQTDKMKNNIQLKIEVIISPVSIVGAIVDYAEHENIDLIVVGTKGKSGFRRILLGSVASGVVTYANCPVMVVK